VRRFNALFKARYRMAPGRLRDGARLRRAAAALSFELAYRPPYDWDAMLAFLRDRAIDGVETVGADAYARTVAIAHRGRAPRRPRRGAARAAQAALRVRVSPSLARAVPAVLSRVKHAFDLACDPRWSTAALGLLPSASRACAFPGRSTASSSPVRAIVGQQISVRAARTVLGGSRRRSAIRSRRSRARRARGCFRRRSRLAQCPPRSSRASA
jgi:AraC family transcriptional regulator of adaptative response / DNA-3-methyladenine glycosylase II